MHTYEYLFAAIIIVAILLSSSTMIGTISEPSRSTSEKEQLKVAAQKLIAQILLDPGDPSDWGSNVDINESYLKAFGLAKHGETTREAYVLDPDKVLRLDNNNPLPTSPSSVINMLNLGNDYGFALRIYPALTLSINLTDPNSARYEVSVNSEYGGLPIVGARVTAKLYYYNVSTQEISSTNLMFNNTTYDGKCTLSFNTTAETKTLIAVADYYRIRVVKAFSTGPNVATAHLFGWENGFGRPSYLILNEPCNISRNNTHEIIVEKMGEGYMIENVTYNLTQMDDRKFSLTYVEPSAAAVLAFSEDAKLILASREANITYSSIPGIVDWSFPFAYSIERTVLIGGCAYIVRLYLWRMSW